MGGNFKIYVDGGAKGNPGPAGIGIIIVDEKGNVIKEISEGIGIKTNNQAEYLALIKGLEEGLKFNLENVDFFLDSELVVRQLKGIYKIKNKELQKLFKKAQKLILKYKNISFSHIPREKNKLTDKLVKKAIKSIAKK